MIKQTYLLAAAVLAMCTLQACSEKTVNAPAAAPVAAPAPTPLPAAAPAPVKAAVAEPEEAPPKPVAKSANAVCGDRKIVVDANCLDLYGGGMLSCTSQSIKIYEDGSGKLLGTKTYGVVKGEGDEPATVDGKISELTCVTAKSGDKYIVTSMYNGGNCEQCEWHELYSWDGADLGSDRDRKVKNKALRTALDAINEKDVDNTTGSVNMEGFYRDDTAD